MLSLDWPVLGSRIIAERFDSDLCQTRGMDFVREIPGIIDTFREIVDNTHRNVYSFVNP